MISTNLSVEGMYVNKTTIKFWLKETILKIAQRKCISNLQV